MTAHHDLDQRLADFLREGPEELPYQSFDTVRDRTEQTGQRVVIGPWRFPEMNKIVTIGLGAAAAVVLAVIVGVQFFGTPSGGTGYGATPTPEPTATAEPTATPEPSPSPAASPPPLTKSFTSTVHGISVSYPQGWIARAATEPWTDRPGVPQYLDPGFDVLHDPVLTDHLFLYFASLPIGDSTPGDWVAAHLASYGCATTEPIAVDGATGLIGADDCDTVAVTSAGRGYQISLLKSDDDPDAVAPYDRAWFEEVLATVQLHPEDAVD
jgi:hypothetical protein